MQLQRFSGARDLIDQIFFNTKVQGLKGSKIENNRWIAFLWTFDPLNLCVEKSLAYKSHAVERRYKRLKAQPENR
jgi:hypothetical protein